VIWGGAEDGDGAGVALVEVREQGAPDWTSAQGVTFWSAEVTIPAQPSYTLEVRATDANGNVSAPESVTFSVDTAGPSLALTTPSYLTGPAAVLTGTATDPLPAEGWVAAVELQFENDLSIWQPANGPFAPNSVGQQGFAYQWDLPHEDGVTHWVRARATDAAGNQTLTAWQAVVVDTLAPLITPTVVITQVEMPQYLVALAAGEAGPVLTGTVSDAAGVSGLQVLIYAPDGGVTVASVPVTAGQWAYTPSFTSASPTGVYALRLQAYDLAGNLRRSGPFNLELVDQSLSALTITATGPIEPGRSATFTATLASGTNVSYTWSFGDGGTATGPVATHIYQTGNLTRTVTVTATNSFNTLMTSTQVFINPYRLRLPLVLR
jgi:chitodextrinase